MSVDAEGKGSEGSEGEKERKLGKYLWTHEINRRSTSSLYEHLKHAGTLLCTRVRKPV